MLLRVTLALDSRTLEESLRDCLRSDDLIVESATPGPGRWTAICSDPPDVLVVSRSLIPAPVVESVRDLRAAPESCQVVVLATGEDVDERARLIAAGCDAVVPPDLPKHLMSDLLREVLQRRREWLATRLEPGASGSGPRLSDFATTSPAMQAFMEVVERITPSNTTVLILGETGVGKERLARAMHAESPRSGGPFIAVNCGALPETLLESELFGHVEGAFTGATRARRGWFELAHGGTLLLDEIGDVPLHLQGKLLRALQEREVQPVGGEKPVRVDVRVMAATNRDLREAVRDGSFRQDLFYRLSVVTLRLPPLRERADDIGELAQSYFDHYRDMLGRDLRGFDESALDALTAYDWPGNVRELMNVVERAVLLSDGPFVTSEDLPLEVREAATGPAGGELLFGRRVSLPFSWFGLPWREVRRRALAGVERAYLDALLEKTRGRVGDTARLAGISPRSLYEKMKSLGLEKETYRRSGTA